MVVDDDEGLRLLLADSLRAEGYTVAAADSGTAAIASLRERQPDLLLLDLQLKDMVGGDLLDALRAESLLVPFIVVTGQGDEKVAVEMMKQGALDYVMKDAAILDLLPSVVKRAVAALERERSLAVAVAARSRLEKEILAISDVERQRFGADLHDGIGQQLTAIELICVGLKTDIDAVDQKLGRQLGKITSMLRQSISETRTLARGLSPLDEQPEAFQNGLANLAAQTESVGRLRCRLECLTTAPLADRVVANHLYRIAQEALHNAVKHSGAKEIVLRWEETGKAYRLEVSDDGRGLINGNSNGLGLGLMSYRADLISAELTVKARPGGGLTVICLLPRPA
jgi:signal transduction histidine kinase